MAHQTMKKTGTKNDGWFGLCPECQQVDGYINIGKSHWFYCKQHQTRWCVGINLFSSWRDQTEAEQRRIYEKLEFHNFERVEPYSPKQVTNVAAVVSVGEPTTLSERS
jgi:hypothetical protein